MTAYYFVEPTDTLFVRGNLAFGDSGEHGASVMPPPPSLFAGAFRSAILGKDPHALARFQREGRTGDQPLDRCLGTLDPGDGRVREAGEFRIAWLSLAGERPQAAMIESIHPLPADLVCLQDPGTGTDDSPGGAVSKHDVRHFARVLPREPSPLSATSQSLPLHATLQDCGLGKPAGDHYLRERGWRKHVAGEMPDAARDGVPARAVHCADPRLGVGLDSASRTASRGLLYTTEGHAFSPPVQSHERREGDEPFVSTGFLVGVDGVHELLDDCGLLRLGGDGRSARYRCVHFEVPRPAAGDIATEHGFRLILLTPGLFGQGWLPDGVTREGDALMLRTPHFSARLACAAVSRHDVVSGWNLLSWSPKPAVRAVPAGSVYWFDRFEGDAGKLADWASAGLSCQGLDPGRRAEGYNAAVLGRWKTQGDAA